MRYKVKKMINIQTIREQNPAEQYEEYLSTPAAEASLHGFFAVYRMRTPDGVHTTKKKPCNKDGHTKEVDAKTRTETGGVNLFTSTAADLMDVYNSPRKSAVIANIRRSITYGAEKRQEEANMSRIKRSIKEWLQKRQITRSFPYSIM